MVCFQAEIFHFINANSLLCILLKDKAYYYAFIKILYQIEQFNNRNFQVN